MEHIKQSQWLTLRKYSVEVHHGDAYVIPTPDHGGHIYNVVEIEEELLCDALNLGKYLTEQPLGHTQQIINFVEKYGLLGIMTDLTSPDMDHHEKNVIHENIFMPMGIVKTQDFADLFFPSDDLDIFEPQPPKIRLQTRSGVYSRMFLRIYRYAEPLLWLEKYFRYLYSYLLCDTEELSGFNHPHITYRIDTSRGLRLACDYVSLKAAIDFAFAKAVTDAKKPIRSCKHCGTIFYAKDARSEFCSPRCRNQYNVYKSRAKHQ